MLSPLKPLLCRHDFYWSERHQADRCRRCGKTQAADDRAATIPIEDEGGVAFGRPGGASRAAGDLGRLPEGFFDLPPLHQTPPARADHVPHPPSAKALKAQARERRDGLLTRLDRIAEGDQLSRQDTLDVLLAVIEDAHSADPVLFGPDAVDRFARLHEARRNLIF